MPFNNAFAPGEKDFDFDINQVSINEERDEAVDFSDGYYDVNQAIVGFDDSRRDRRHHGRRPAGAAPRRPGGHDQPRLHHRA